MKTKVIKAIENLNDPKIIKHIHDLLFPCECKTLKNKNSFAVCTECEKKAGWHCQESPDKKCHYFSFKHKKNNKYFVLLQNDEKYYLPENYQDHEYETEDSCLFCGDPEERK